METKEDKLQIKLALTVFLFIAIVFFIMNIYNIADFFLLRYVDYIKLTEPNNNNKIAQAGQFGDLIGGVLGTIFGIVGTYLVWQTLIKQQLNFKKERFENRFFELIKIYRDSVDDMNIADKVKGRKCFVSMYKEFKTVYEICEKVYEDNNLKVFENPSQKEISVYKEIYNDAWKNKYVKSKICEFAYNIFFSGIGLNSEKYLDSGNRIDKDYYDLVKIKLLEKQEEFIAFFDIENKSEITESQEEYQKSETVLDMPIEEYNKIMQSPLTFHPENRLTQIKYKTVLYKFPISYFPFDGHISRLGHYYRQLFQIVRYVVSFKDKLFDDEEIHEYLKVLRTQLSNHEQLLLYYNGVTGVGSKWLNDTKNNNINYFVDYKMIHNVPFPLAEFGINIEDRFAKERKLNPDLFEWDWYDEQKN